MHPPEHRTRNAATRFAARDPGPAARIGGFVAHLRDNGYRVGVAETEAAMEALTHVEGTDPEVARLALKAVCAGCADEVKGFDALFDAYWLNSNRVRQKVVPTPQSAQRKHSRSSREDSGSDPAAGQGRLHEPDASDAEGTADRSGTGKLVASATRSLMTRDLRELVSPQDIREAEQIALQLGKALRDRRSRRTKAARSGARIDLRRTIRASLQTGGEPLRLARRCRPDRPLKITALCDVSGSMVSYARPFLAFLAGLMRADTASDAYLFHTRLVRITDALRDDDPLRTLNRLTLLAEGFGGGSQIGEALDHFSRTYARRLVDGRSVVMILSDGYDSGPTDRISKALTRLKKRGCRVIWLNPLKGWEGYEPVARGMAAALPHLDLFAAANRLADFAALEKELTRL